MRVLILGADGMLGHRLFLTFAKSYEVFGTLRSRRFANLLGESGKIIHQVDAMDRNRIRSVIKEYTPDYVINCIGIIKQKDLAKDSILSLEINALLPHYLALYCDEVGAKLIHFSTDCVFNGSRGNYKVDDPSDCNDLYGKSKYLGEVNASHALTIRTSIIGRELKGKQSLVEWFLSQHGQVYGYTKAIYSGLPTATMAKILEKYVFTAPEISGVYQVASNPISKFDLLGLIAKEFNCDISIVPSSSVSIDRSLDGRLFSQKTGFQAPAWEVLVKDLTIDNDLYNQ
ncbi:MAG: SDR family oxidoreductase [Bdellovibrionota bacterium]